MVDIPNNSSTSATLTVGSNVTNSLEVVGDHDWFRVQLTAGQPITVTLNGLTLTDPYLRIRDAFGNVLFYNDDISTGVNLNSQISFSAPTAGSYYVDVGAWNDSSAGTYQVSVTSYVPPPLYTYDQIADQLVSGYWNGDVRRFNVSQGGQISVNLVALTFEGQSLARAALGLWGDIIAVNFVETSSGGQIVFDDDQDGAFANATHSGGFISAASVNVGLDWLTDYGTTQNSYSFQTYIHEIGHALGLGHAGNYNATANYSVDALYRNDCWSTTIMSYFSQTDNTYFGGLGFDENFVVTPMIADIVAMQQLYGLSTTTRTGNDFYGLSHTNAGALCVFDSGGIDWIDVSGTGGDHLINLNAGTFSNIMGEIGNLSIALGVTIENARSSSGHDTLIGNDADNLLDASAGNDTLNGGLGNDWLLPGWGNNLVDGGPGIDTLDYAGGMTAGSNVNLVLGTATNQGGFGHDTLISIENVRGTTYDDTIVGNSAANDLEGHFGRDTISGGDGDDILYGDAREVSFGGENDVLNGGAGADILIGQGGVDTLTGGAGNDTFADISAGLNGDTITDFARGDRILLTDATLGLAVGLTTGMSGSQLTYGSASFFLSNVRNPSIAFSAAPEGGVQIVFSGPPIIISSAVVSDPSSGAFSSQSAAAPLMPREYAEHGFLYCARQLPDSLNFRVVDDLFVAS